MATYTSHYNLTKPEGTERVNIAIINQNMDSIDAQMYKNAQSIIANHGGMAIPSNNNTHAAVSSGQYVYVYNHSSLAEGMYVAKSAISTNGALSLSNLTAVSNGGLNHVYSTLNSNMTSYVNFVQVDYGSNSFFIYWKVGKIVCVEIYYNVLDGTIPAWSAKKIGTLPIGFRPKTNYTKTRLISDREASDAVMANVDGAGDIRIITKYKPFEASGSIATGTMIFPTTE